MPYTENTAMLYVGITVVAAISILVGVRLAGLCTFRGLVASVLLKAYPAAIQELLRRRRLSFWYKTSQSDHDQRVWGYVDCHSIDPGGKFHLMLSSGPGVGDVTGKVEIFRIGFYKGTDRRQVWRSDLVEVVEHGINNSAAALGPAWPVALAVDNTASWSTGYHSIDFVEPDGSRHEDIAFLVVTEPQRKADVLVKLATATYQAYNRWGGHSLYPDETPSVFEGRGLAVFESDVAVNRGDIVSFDRPARSEFWEWEYHFVLWLERLAEQDGFSVAYATGFDTARDPAVTSDCKLLISVGHDEYWSKEEFDHAYDRIFRDGGHTMFLGSNTAYWQVRYVDVNSLEGNEGRQMVCFKSMSDPIRHRIKENPELHVTARFREDARRPETMLMGVAFQSNLPFRHHDDPRYAYRVVNADLLFFEGTGYRRDDFVADIIGHEWDNRDPEASYECPGEDRVDATERLWRQDHSHIDPIPSTGIQTVFAGEVVDVWGRKGLAEAVYFESPAGAKVFSSGTNRWTWGLGKSGYAQEKFQRFNRNLVLHFLDRASQPASEE